jgi:hypothetical protein
VGWMGGRGIYTHRERRRKRWLKKFGHHHPPAPIQSSLRRNFSRAHRK